MISPTGFAVAMVLLAVHAFNVSAHPVLFAAPSIGTAVAFLWSSILNGRPHSICLGNIFPISIRNGTTYPSTASHGSFLGLGATCAGGDTIYPSLERRTRAGLDPHRCRFLGRSHCPGCFRHSDAYSPYFLDSSPDSLLYLGGDSR
jgi:hypothetical protein